MKKRKSIHIYNTKVGVSDWIAPINSNYYGIDIKSWFNIDKFDNPKRAKIKYIVKKSQ